MVNTSYKDVIYIVEMLVLQWIFCEVISKTECEWESKWTCIGDYLCSIWISSNIIWKNIKLPLKPT